MPDPSYVLFVPDSVAAIQIDWTRVPEKTKEYLRQEYGYDWNRKRHRAFPKTIEDFAKFFHETKFFGYLEPELITALMDISKFGFEPARPTGSGGGSVTLAPRFYMYALAEVWFILFAPGSTEYIIGHSGRESLRDYNYFEDDTKVKAIAQEFDAKLEHNAQRGIRGELAATTSNGWTTTEARTCLRFARFGLAMIKSLFPHPIGLRGMGEPSETPEDLNIREGVAESAQTKKKVKKRDAKESTANRKTRQSPRLKKQKMNAAAKKTDQKITRRVTRRMTAEKKKASGSRK